MDEVVSAVDGTVRFPGLTPQHALEGLDIFRLIGFEPPVPRRRHDRRPHRSRRRYADRG